MKIEYDFYDENCPRCEANIPHIFDARIGSVSCQGCANCRMSYTKQGLIIYQWFPQANLSAILLNCFRLVI